MRNVIVLGSGRSGTSMVAGTMAQAGWFVGAKPYPARSSNPKGFFESADVNGINEYLLARAAPTQTRLGPWQHWLVRLPDEVECRATPQTTERIARLTRRSPWCFKDPRLCYTLPVWREVVPDPALVCVFRDPAETAKSILKEVRQEAYLQGLTLDFEAALDVWRRMYRRVLDVHRKRGDWLFLHYEQVLSERGLDTLEGFVEGRVARGFPESSLHRSRADDPLPPDIADTYAELCEIAGYSTPHRQRRAALTVTSDAVGEDLVTATLRTMPGGASATGVSPWLDSIAATECAIHARRSHSTHELAAERETHLEFIDQRWPQRALWERSLEQLGALDLGLLESAGFASLRTTVQPQMNHLLRELAQLAIRERRVRDIDALLDQRAELERSTPWPIATTATRRLLAWPAWERDELERVLALFIAARGASDPSDCALCLRFDGDVDGDKHIALERLRQAYEGSIPSDTAVDVVVLDETMSPDDWPRLGRAVEAWFELDSSQLEPRARTLAALAAPKWSDSNVSTRT